MDHSTGKPLNFSGSTAISTPSIRVGRESIKRDASGDNWVVGADSDQISTGAHTCRFRGNGLNNFQSGWFTTVASLTIVSMEMFDVPVSISEICD